MKKFWKILLLTVLAALILGTFYFLYRNSAPKEKRYEELTAATGTVERLTVISGKIEPRTEIAIKPQISGIISEILLEPGDKVRVGDVIAKISVVPDANQLSNAESRVSLARMALEQTQREHQRMTRLKEQDYISVEEWEKSALELSKQREELDAALDNLNIVKEGISQKNATMSNTLVRSTIDGIILDIPVKRGNSVIMANTMNDGTTIATVADMSDLIFRGKIDETEIGQIRKGMDMSITLGALPDSKLSATLEYISPKSVEENGSNTFEIKAAMHTANTANLRSGYSANASIALQRAAGVITLPESAVTYQGDSTFVYLIPPHATAAQARRTPVTTGISDGVNVEVTSGVKAGQKVRGKEITE